MSMRRASRTRILRTLEEQVPISKEEQEEHGALVDGGEEGRDQEVHASDQQNHADSIWIRGRNGVDRELKRRVTIKDLSSSLDEGDRVIVRCNRSYEPNTKAAYLFSSFLYDIVTIETCAPLSILTWDNVCFDDYKIKMIRLIESKFLYHVNVRTWVLDKLNRAWRKYKAGLKKIYNSFATVSDALKNIPENVNVEHWRVLVSDWCSEKKKKQCEINRSNCKSKKNYHAHGRKSLARMSKELEDEKDWDSPECGTSTEVAQRKKALKSLSDKDTCSVTSKDKYHDKKRKTIALTSEQAYLALEATPKKTARIKTSQVGNTRPSETITPQIIRSEPVVPYTRKSRRLANSTPSKQLPLSSKMHYASESSDSKRKRIVDPGEEALMVEESEEDVDDGSDEDYDASGLEAPNFSSNEEDHEDEGKDNGVAEEVGAEMEGAPEETIAAIDQLVEEVNRPSGQEREPEENEERIAAPRKGNSKKGHEKRKKALKDDNPNQKPDTAPGKQPKAVILPHPSQDHLVGASSSNPNQFTGNDNTHEILSHASQFEQIVKKMQDDCLHLCALYLTNMEKLKVKDDSVAILSSKCGALEEEAKGLREEKVLLKRRVEGLEIRLKEAEKSLPSEELEEKLLQLQLELNDARSREIEAKRALAGKELEMIQKDNEILRLKAQRRSNSRLSNCTCNSTKSLTSSSLEITKELVDQVMASDIFKSQQAIKEYEWMYYSMRCALIRAHFNLNIPSDDIWKIVTMHPNEAAIASETEGSILQYINHVLSLWVQLMNKGSGSPEEQAEFVKQLQEVPFPFTDGKEAFQYQKKQGSQPDPWYDMYDRSFGSPSVPTPSLSSAAAIVSARSKDDDLLWRFDG